MSVALDPYPLPAPARQALLDLAAQSDVLILGEIHGTQEVPAIAAALLEPLTKLGYQALALEIPADQREPLVDWATGKSTMIPDFFANPYPDGRGNIQTLSLIRAALSLPGWQLICFDQSTEDFAEEDPRATKIDDKQAVTMPSADEMIALSLRRDATMAIRLASERTRLALGAKVLAICGNFHARTANSRLADHLPSIPADSPFHKLWPSFAAALANNQPTWRVRSVNVVPHSGGYFAMVATGDVAPAAARFTRFAQPVNLTKPQRTRSNKTIGIGSWNCHTPRRQHSWSRPVCVRLRLSRTTSLCQGRVGRLLAR